MVSIRTDVPQNGIKDKTFTSLGSLVRLLPTGTVFMFQFLNPLLTNNGRCHQVNKYLDGVLIALCGLSCFFSSFTDSYVGADGSVHYGIATLHGFWPRGNPDSSVDLSNYRLRFGDFVHATLCAMVFGVVSLLDSNTVQCFYPKFEDQGRVLLMTLPPVIGAISGAVFVMFPNKRHGIGYPSDNRTVGADDGAKGS